MSWLERYRTHSIALLVIIIVIGGAVFLYRQTSLPHSTEIVISSPSPEITVYVEGEVACPGVYTLTDGGLIEDAIQAAGGFTPDADQGTVNLAASLRDGNQIHVYAVGDAPQKVNINTAEAWLLEALPGIGEVLAQRIIDYRSVNGPFQQIDDLARVDGIGPATFEDLKDKVKVR
jgi:competence protein ComEA